MARVVINNKYAFIDKTGNFVGQKFDQAWDFQENGLAKIKIDGKYGYIDSTGNYVIEPLYDYINFAYPSEYELKKIRW